MSKVRCSTLPHSGLACHWKMTRHRDVKNQMPNVSNAMHDGRPLVRLVLLAKASSLVLRLARAWRLKSAAEQCNTFRMFDSLVAHLCRSTLVVRNLPATTYYGGHTCEWRRRLGTLMMPVGLNSASLKISSKDPNACLERSPEVTRSLFVSEDVQCVGWVHPVCLWCPSGCIWEVQEVQRRRSC